MKRRSFLAAAIGAMFQPALPKAAPLALGGWEFVDCTMNLGDYLAGGEGQAGRAATQADLASLCRVEIGRYEGFRFIESKP